MVRERGLLVMVCRAMQGNPKGGRQIQEATGQKREGILLLYGTVPYWVGMALSIHAHYPVYS